MAAAEADGLWVVPGTPYRDDEAVLAEIRRARTAGMPILGTCGGFQYMLVEFARNVAGLEAARPRRDRPRRGDSGRVAALVQPDRARSARSPPWPGTRVADLCGTEPFTGFHWCNYGLAPDHEAALVAAGLVVAARAPDAGVEAVELPGHPFYVATLFQPQVGSSASRRLHPLIDALCSAADGAQRDR